LAFSFAAHAKALGPPEPESGLGVFLLLGESRARVREMFEVEPLGKLLALVLRAEYFKKYGFEHPPEAVNIGASWISWRAH
jgi:phthiodiolone/phenolphthiodiolone dimycocerosates ketoreductase